jgi:hypothetical protein
MTPKRTEKLFFERQFRLFRCAPCSGAICQQQKKWQLAIYPHSHAFCTGHAGGVYPSALWVLVHIRVHGLRVLFTQNQPIEVSKWEHERVYKSKYAFIWLADCGTIFFYWEQLWHAYWHGAEELFFYCSSMAKQVLARHAQWYEYGKNQIDWNKYIRRKKNGKK